MNNVVRVKRGGDGEETPNEVGPDIYRFVVYVEQGGEDFIVGGLVVAVAGVDVGVVTAPRGQIVPVQETLGGGFYFLGDWG